MTFSHAYHATRAAEVTFAATVTGAPRFFYGSKTHAENETFDVSTAAGPGRVIDNVDSAPQVPVQPGDRVIVRGELVHDPGRMPVVHWTHHDPAARHAGGFIQYQGRVYA